MKTIEKYYSTEPDKDAITEITEAFNNDFPDGKRITSIESALERFCNNEATATINDLKDGAYSVEITRPLGTVRVKKGSFFSMERHEPELLHRIIFRQIGIRPNSGYRYEGDLDFHDRCGDIKSFLIGIDGKIHKKGFFMEACALQVAFLARTEMQLRIRNNIVQFNPEELPLECVKEDGKNFGYSGSGVMMFGRIPEGEHELIFYAMDQRGNRSFAVVPYKI